MTSSASTASKQKRTNKRPSSSASADQNPKRSKRAKTSSCSDLEEHKNGHEDQLQFTDFEQNITDRRLQSASNASAYAFNESRVRSTGDGIDGVPPPDMQVTGVLYWMSRDQRVQDNWAMIYAQSKALQYQCPLFVVFCLQPSFLNATIRHYDFMLKGLRLVDAELKALAIPFRLVLGAAKDTIPALAKQHGINLVVTDFNPLRICRQWVSELAPKLQSQNIHLAQVDAHNVVPVWVASNKQEYAARTIRSKINRNLGEYLVEFPPIVTHEYNNEELVNEAVDWEQARGSLTVDMSVTAVDWCRPGGQSALRALFDFLQHRLKQYAADRNDPNKEAVSTLSAWYHFGQLSPQRSALEVSRYKSKHKESVESYLEELIVRRELSDNFCFYNARYDEISGASSWAQDTLQLHEADEREWVYTQRELETYQTHDDLWNAAQKQLVRDGRMHGFLRMYWAKKILEWTATPQDALHYAIFFNDKYAMDSRDPNNYVGCMWSICGIHDQGWKERPIFGKIRFMNYKGCQRKFKVADFVKKMGVKAITK